MAAGSRAAKVSLCLALVLLVACSAWAAAPGPMLKRFLAGPMAGVEEILFAVRGVGGDGHWYANFGHRSNNPKARNYGPPGGRLCRLHLRTGKVQVVLADAQGGVRDPQVHYDAKKVLFSYRKGDSSHYHLFEVNLDGTGVRQLTDGPFDDLEAIYLPDGDLLFCSSRSNRCTSSPGSSSRRSCSNASRSLSLILVEFAISSRETPLSSLSLLRSCPKVAIIWDFRTRGIPCQQGNMERKHL